MALLLFFDKIKSVCTRLVVYHKQWNTNHLYVLTLKSIWKGIEIVEYMPCVECVEDITVPDLTSFRDIVISLDYLRNI